ncbi:uncharacterized protein JCM6883_007481 [Sporobolomyces salmoneus]|uniref:uncharacterized protein n=1 Tax=Sporobolomyces salmoneus TaxID=183962 RepID=UPI003180EB6D
MALRRRKGQDFSFEDLRTAIEDAHEALIARNQGQSKVTTKFGTTFDIDDWATYFRGLFNGKESWWNGLTINVRRIWVNRLEDGARHRLSTDIYSCDFPSETRCKGLNAGPVQGADEWLENVIASDLKILSIDRLENVTATTLDALHCCKLSSSL